MKNVLKSALLTGVGALLLTLPLLPLRGDQSTLKIERPAPPPKQNPLTFKLQVQSDTNGMAYVIQASTNLVDWKPVLTVKPPPGEPVSASQVPATNDLSFFRLVGLLSATSTNTNGPVWTNGVGDGFSLLPPAILEARWKPATDTNGITGYRLILNGAPLTNVSGTTLSCQFAIDLHQRTDLRLQAVNAAGGTSDILSLVYLPGDGIVAISDDGGRLYLVQLLANGTFGPARQVASFNSNDRGVGVGDFDHDGILDVIAGGASGDTLTPFFLKGKGDGTFAAPVALPTLTGANGYMMDATVGDFDADGNLDFVANGNNRYVFFYWGNGDGTFKAEVKDWGDYGRGTVSGDFNEDGREDILRGEYNGPGRLRLFLSNGDRTFTETNQAGQYGSDRYGVAAGDFDEDGHLELLANNSGSGDIVFYKGVGDGTFTATGTNTLWNNLDVNTYAGMDAFDYDGDSHLDLVMATANGQAFYWSGLGDGTFSTNRVQLATGMSGAFGISAPPRPPRVDVQIAPANPATNLNEQLQLRAVGAGVAGGDIFRWTYGDVGTNPVAWTFATNMANMGQATQHAYTNEGRFLARLWHTSAGGVHSTRGAWVTIKGTPPVADPGGPYVFDEHAATQTVWTATLDGSASTDDFGIVKYVWNFGDGSGATNAVPRATHSWTNSGVWNVSLTVYDSAGQTNTKGATVTFNPGAPPVAAIQGPAMVDETAAKSGLWNVTFYATNSTDDFGIWKYEWQFGDGKKGTGSTVQTTYAAASNYVVTLVVTDHAGQTNATTHAITVNANNPPVAAINGPDVIDETAAKNGVWTTTFYATNSTDDYGIWKYEWQFGDGKTGAGSTVQTTYGAVGDYVVKLLVTDHAGQTNAATHALRVKANDLPTPLITGPRLLTEDSATNGLWYGTWDGLASLDDRGVYRWEWNFGDGAKATDSKVSHGYAGQGVYPLALTVYDFGNQSVTLTQNVIVVPGEPPVARITASTLTPEGSEPVALSGRTSTDDHGILSYLWQLPPVQFDFAGNVLDTNQWATSFAKQDGKLLVSGQGNWGRDGFYARDLQIRRGGSLEGRIDTPTGDAFTMVGFKNMDNTTHYTTFAYALYFVNGEVRIYEYGNDRGKAGDFTRGNSYDFRIEIKPGAGARYFVRSSGTGAAFTKIFETGNYSDAALRPGADVYAGAFGFDDLVVTPGYSYMDVTAPVFPGGDVYLQVVDHALQTNTAKVTIRPVTGAPPLAVISGPTNGLTGVELAFNGYLSSDDHAVASYAWDFGDGSPVAFGPAVAHHYNIAGTYTNQLTVRDYASQASIASLVVTVTGSNALVCVPWQIINGVLQPHEVYAGKTNTLKAVARGVAAPFDAIWDFADGSGSVTNTFTNRAAIYNLEAVHAFNGSDGTPIYPTIRLVQTNGTVLSDTYFLVIRPKTLDVEMKMAIDEGLWHLHKIQAWADLDTNNKAGYWSDVGYQVSPTASAVQAFAVNGHLLTGDAARDPYVDTVQRGINYLLTRLTTYQIGPRRFGDPDGNHNGLGLSADGGRQIYETGPLMDALVAAGRPELVAGVGGANVRGRTFREIMQDLVDMYAWGQYDGDAGGGWRYGWQEFPDNSAAQWGAIGLLAAEHYFGIPVPDWVKARNLVWVAYSANGNGFGYTGPGTGEATTPSGLVQLAYDGVATTNALWLQGENYIANEWQGIMDRNNLYAHYAIAKAMRTAIPQPVHNFTATGLDWFRDPTRGMARRTIDRQRADGSWVSSAHVGDPLSTAWSTIILSSSLFQQGPVAVANVKPNPSAVGYPVIFDARGSYHQHPAYKVVDYRWIFDSSKGVDFEHPDATGPVATNIYGAFSTNTVWLQVRDNGTPQLSDSASVVVRTTIPPYPPAADAGGPYVVCAGQSLHLDGSGSFTVDAAAGNFLQSYEWETAFQNPLQFKDATGVRPVITNGFATAGQYRVGLRVKNANSLVYTNIALPDMTAEAFASVFVYNRVIPDLAVRSKANKCQLTWTKAGDYAVVLRSEDGPDRGFTEIGRTDSAYATFLDTNVVYNIEYFYRVYAYQNGRTEVLGVSDPVFAVSPPRSFDQHAPKFVTVPLRVAQAGQLYQVTLETSNPENQLLHYAKLAGPDNLQVNATNGVVEFTPTADQVGNHPVSFQVTNQIGRDVLSYTLFVFPATNHPPVAVANGPYAALAGEDIQFSSAGTRDPDNDPLRYFWNFGDGSMSTNANPVHSYGGVGDYLVTLFVNDGFGGTHSSLARVAITRPNRAPVMVLAGGSQYTVRLGEPVTVDGSKSYDLDGNPLTYTWLWGDGSTTNNTTGAGTHIYTAAGDYPGTFVVNDNEGGRTTNLFHVTVTPANQAPAISLAVTNTTPYVMTPVAFDATGTTDPENDPLAFEWDFGDRTRTTGPLVTHVFRQVGDFTVALRVVDNHGGSSVITQVVHAVNAPPVFTSNPPLLWRSGTNYTYVPTLTDLDEDARTFQLVKGPPTMACDTNTGALNWLPGTGDIGPHEVVLRATDAGGDATDQAFTLVISTPLGPQLDLEPVHIAMTNAIVDSQTLALSGTVRVTFRNNGVDPVPVPFTVSVYTGAERSGSRLTNATGRVGYGTFPAGLLARQEGWIEMSLQGRASFKDAPLYAYVDSESVVPEYNEANNLQRSGFDASTNQPPVVDLSGSLLVVDRTALPARARLTARLGNSGLVAVPAQAPMAFYDGDPKAGGVLIGTAATTAALEPGEYADLSVDWASPTLVRHQVYAVADDPGTGTFLYAEISAANNGVSAAADLAAVDPPIADAGPDQTVALGDTVVLNGYRSQDPQGKSLTYRWSFLSIPIQSRTQLSGPNTAVPSFQADAAGPYTLQLVVNNGQLDSTNRGTLKITAVDTNQYYPPRITSTPSFQAMVNTLYQYPVTAVDPQSKPLAFRLSQAPAGMIINTNTGLIQWTPTNTGSFFLQVNADGIGGTAYQTYSLTVVSYTNLPPVFTSTPVQLADPGAAYTYTAVAADPNRDPVTYALAKNPAGMTINAQSGIISWTPAVGQLGGNLVSLTASDGKGGTATQTFNLVVIAGGAGGFVVQPIPDQVISEPAGFAAIPLDSYVLDPGYPASRITWKVTGASQLQVAVDSNRVATVTFAPGTLASEQLTFLATNPDGKSAFATATFTVRGVDHPPVAALANLSDIDTTTIDTGFFELKGTAADPDAIDEVAYRILLYDPNGARVADVTPGPVNAAGWHEGRVASGGSLGNLDLTMVRNGGYVLSLEVRGGGQTANAVGLLTLDSQLKIGQVKFSEQDLVLPVQGVGLQVVRTYDSLNPTSADFGYSWAYSVVDLGLTINEQRAETQELFDETTFSLRTGGGRDVTLDLPDTGQRVTFTYSLANAGWFKARATWTPPAGVKATLEPLGSGIMIQLFNLPPFWQDGGLEVDRENFDFPGFILTLRDGTQYLINREDLGDHWLAGEGTGSYAHCYGKAYLTRITTAGGDRTDFVRDGRTLKNIEQYDNASRKLKSILFQRDSQQRITAIYTPENLDANGVPSGPASVIYEYDSLGNLVQVSRLRDSASVDKAYATATYLYSHPRFPHLLTEIKDSRGVSIMRAEFDAQGRLTGTIDASGGRIAITRDLSARTETIFDRLGNATQFAYDLKGNVIAKTDALGNTTRFTFDADNRETSRTDALGNTTRLEYDASGNPVAMIDALGNRSAYSFDSGGRTTSVKDPLGRTSTVGYDSAGRMTRTVNSAGLAVDYQYDGQGHPVTAINARGVAAGQYSYDSAGRPAQALSPTGVKVGFSYDARGYQTGSLLNWVNPDNTNDVRVLTTRTDFDDAGRITNSVNPRGLATSMAFNDFNKPVRAVDALGNVTLNTYDIRGNLIETSNPDGTIVRAVYDANDRLVVKTERCLPGAPAYATLTIYDAVGRAVASQLLSNAVVAVDAATNSGGVIASSRFVSAGGVVSSNQVTFDAAGRMTSQLDARGALTRYEYSAAGLNTAVIDAQGNRTEYEYDAAGHATLVRSAAGQEVHFLYDLSGRIVRRVYTDGSSSRTVYDDQTGTRSDIDELGQARDRNYDTFGRLAEVVLPEVADPTAINARVRPRYTYENDLYGNLRSVRDPLGRLTHYERNEFNQLVSRTLPDGKTEHHGYDNYGRLNRNTDFNGQVTELLYDSMGRIAQENHYAPGATNSGKTITFSYDGLGRVSQVAEARGTTYYTYDSRDRITRIASPDGTVNYEYDSTTGSLIRTWTAHSDTRYGYDVQGRLSTVTMVQRHGQVLPQPEATSFTYDAVGNRLSVKRPNGVTTRYQYDDRSRLALLAHYDAATNLLASYRYTVNAIGQRTAVAEIKRQPGGGFTTNLAAYVYDGLGRLLTETNSLVQSNRTGFSTQYGYDLAGNRIQRKVTVGGRTLTTTYAYDANDRLLLESNSVAAASAGLSPFPVRTLGPDGTVQVAYRPLPSAWPYYALRSLPFALLAAFILPAAVLFRRHRRSIAVFSTDLSPYRALLPRCLAGFLAALMAVTSFDLRALADEASLYAALSTDTWGLDGSVTRYEYDANGSVTRKATTGPQAEAVDYAYTLDHLLSSATRTATNGASVMVEKTLYGYNYQGDRVRTESHSLANGVETSSSTNCVLVDRFNLTGLAQVLEEAPAVGANPSVTYAIGDETIAQYRSEAGLSAADYFLCDGHGSTRQLASEQGGLEDSFAYDAFGIMLGDQLAAGNARTKLLYTGQRFEDSLQQYNLRARDYDPGTGRFSSMDTLAGSTQDPLSLHKYAYTGHDPVNRTDPTGHDWCLSAQMVAVSIISILAVSYISTFAAFVANGSSPDAWLYGANVTIGISGIGAAYMSVEQVKTVAGVLTVPNIVGSTLASDLEDFAVQMLETVGVGVGTYFLSAVMDGVYAGLKTGGAMTKSIASFTYSFGAELLDTALDRKFSGWAYHGPGLSVGAPTESPASIGITFYGGVVWGTPKWKDYAGPFVGVAFNFAWMNWFGGTVAWFFSPKDVKQNGVFSGASFGTITPGIGGSTSLSYYNNIMEGTDTLNGVTAYDALRYAFPPGVGVDLQIKARFARQ